MVVPRGDVDEHPRYLQGAREGAVAALTDGVAARLAFRGRGDGDSEAVAVEINIESSFVRPGGSECWIWRLRAHPSCRAG